MDEKANKSNKYAVCKCCIEGSIYEEAYKNRITNTQQECRHYLNFCQFFIAKYPNETECNNILNLILENNLQETDETTLKISSTISNESSSKLQKKDMQTDQLDVTLTYDSWKNIKKKSLLGIALINSKGKILIWDAKNLSERRTRWSDIVQITNDLFTKFE
ncbi:13213_t:CDS:2 [Cetraspora pellucida]|uniref:13213_t:CDS:1 n=1 Tax=Cetraspora pellucida TaxID=1433469 RepID=A0A9N9EE34_9GLOM|nr:13213_t:CDS:2 [Cetraspora pellucida]